MRRADGLKLASRALAAEEDWLPVSIQALTRGKNDAQARAASVSVQRQEQQLLAPCSMRIQAKWAGQRRDADKAELPRTAIHFART
jgi:hypothetical protein